jgi:hypothetical protein
MSIPFDDAIQGCWALPLTGSAGGGNSSGSILLLTSNGTGGEARGALDGRVSLAAEAVIDITRIGPCLLLATTSSAVRAKAAAAVATAPLCRGATLRDSEK